MKKIPEGYLLRKGDKVVVTGVVVFNVDAGESTACVEIASRKVWIELGDLEMKSFRFKTDDWVLAAGDAEQLGQVVAIHDSFVWTKMHDGRMATYVAEVLEPTRDPTAAESPLLAAVTEAMQEPPPPALVCEVCGESHPEHELCKPKPNLHPMTKPDGFDGDDEEPVF